MMRCVLLCMSTLVLVITLSACSRSPRVTFYTLQNMGNVGSASKAATGRSVVIGSVTIPDVVDRPQLVLRVAANRVEILEAHRWAEPLKSEIPRLVADSLGELLGSDKIFSSLQASGADAEYRIVIDITKFEAFPGEAVKVEADWSLRRTPGRSPITGHFELREPVKADGYDSLVAAFSRAIQSMSGDLAKVLSTDQM